MRKIIQIVDCPDNQTSQGCIFGLCNDGSLWAFSCGKWEIVSSGVPQRLLEAEEAVEEPK